MKNSVKKTFCVVCLAALAGCATPKKSQVQAPPPNQFPPPVSTQQPSQPLPPVQPVAVDPKTAYQPNYLEIEPEPAVEQLPEVETALPSMVYVNDRIFEYGRKLERWKELDAQSANLQVGSEEATQMVRCFRRLQEVLNGYSELRGRILQASQLSTAQRISNEQVFDLQKSDVAFLESTCGRLLSDPEDQSLGWSQREAGADLNQLETLIDRHGANREYEEIVRIWQQIPEHQTGRVHVRTKILYGNALMFLHQEEKAAAIYQQVVDQMSDSDEQATDLVSLRRVLGDLYTASGNYGAAQREYRKISADYQNLGQLEEWSKLQLSILDRAAEGGPELGEYAAILRNYLGFIPDQDGYKVAWEAENFITNYPYSPVISNVEFIKEKVNAAADRWFTGFMESVDQLGTEKKYEESLELMETMPKDIISPDQQIILKKKADELLLAEAVEKETERMAQIQELQHQWNNGLLLVQEGRYEEAIGVFTNLLDTEYSTKAEAKIAEISLEAAKADRKQAADLFIRYTRTTDLDSKRKLLLESRRLLKGILQKYPGVEIASKVQGNIQRVEQEMNSLDPGLLAIADRQDNGQTLEGPDQVFAAPPQLEVEQSQLPITESDLALPPLQ